eukprot:symbB.v1.2.029948.t1/scaffold3326.1/size58984/1
MADDSLVEEKGKVEERRLGGEDSIAQEIAKLCESCCLLSPNAIAASGLSKGDSRFAWPWLNLTMGLTGFACLALWRRRSPGGGLLSRWAQGSLFAVSSWQCFKVLTRAIVKWEAKRACNALLWLFGEVSSHHCVNSFPLVQDSGCGSMPPKAAAKTAAKAAAKGAAKAAGTGKAAAKAAPKAAPAGAGAAAAKVLRDTKDENSAEKDQIETKEAKAEEAEGAEDTAAKEDEKKKEEEARQEAAKLEEQRKAEEAERERKKQKANGDVVLKYSMYDEKFPIKDGKITAKEIDETYCLSDVMPGCKIHLSSKPSEEKYKMESVFPYIFEEPLGTFHDLEAGETYHVFVEEDEKEFLKSQEKAKQNFAGVRSAATRGEGCSCLEGNPCAQECDAQGNSICKDWANRFANGILWESKSFSYEVQGAYRGLRLSSIAADFYSTAETQARQLCADFSGSVGALPPPGAHPGAARLRLAFARAWELQEVLLLVALRSCSEGRLRDAWIELRSVRCIAQDGARSLRRTGEVVGAPGAGLGAGVSLSLALATFSQAMKRRKEVLHSPEAYHTWLQDLIGQLEAHLDDLSKVNPPKIQQGEDKTLSEEVCPPTDSALSEGQLLEAAGYTVLHEALGRRAAPQLAASSLSQEEEMQLRKESQSAWRSCVDELQGKLDKKSGAARLWQQRQECTSRIARVCNEDDDLQAWGDLPEREEGAARHARRWRPSQAQQELMQALSLRLDGRKSRKFSTVVKLRMQCSVGIQWITLWSTAEQAF